MGQKKYCFTSLLLLGYQQIWKLYNFQSTSFAIQQNISIQYSEVMSSGLFKDKYDPEIEYEEQITAGGRFSYSQILVHKSDSQHVIILPQCLCFFHN